MISQRISSAGPAKSLEVAILRAIAYGDVFDYPLSAAEIHRYLPETYSRLEEVEAVLEGSPFITAHTTRAGELWTLAGREQTLATRHERAQNAAILWPNTVLYGRTIARLPFTRMVAVTGALAVNNEPGIDIDYLIVTAPGRLWLNRLLVIATVKRAAQRGVSLCPNYLLSERALVFNERNLYTAHELSQMIPLYGLDVYQTIRDLNRWCEAFLPNASGSPSSPLPTSLLPATDRLKRLGEFALHTPPGGWIERWEMRRKIRKFQGNPAQREASFSPDYCKGHFSGHEQRILEMYAARLRALGQPVMA